MGRRAGRRARRARRSPLTFAAAALVLGALLPIAGSTPAVAAEVARLDPSFGGGLATYELSDVDDEATAVAVQDDGSVIVVGRTGWNRFTPTPSDIFAARFTPSGSLDPSFGAGGVAIVGLPDQSDLANAVVVQEDGRVVIAGVVDGRGAVLRLTATGALDPEFQGGIARVSDSVYEVRALALQEDGKIVFTGTMVSVGRLNADGALDTTFGTNGQGWTPGGPTLLGETQNHALAVQRDGKIVAGGQRNYPSFDGAGEFAGISRFTAGGVPDETFSDDGYAETRLHTPAFRRGTTISDVVIQPDGRIVAVGQTYDGGGVDRQYRATLYRYLPDGRLDEEFAGRGAVMSRIMSPTIPSQGAFGIIGVPGSWTNALSVSLQPDGGLLVVGNMIERGTISPLVLRYTSAGLLDTTFAREGSLVLEVGGRHENVTAAAVQPDGRLVVVGWARTGYNVAGNHSDVIVGRVIPASGEGTVWTWGWNAMGQLGHGSNVHRASPTQVPGLTGVVAVSAGAYHTLALRGDGTVWSWGWNNYGQLGDGTTVDRARPVRVPGLSGVVAVSAGGLHSLAVRGDGTVWGWGFNGFGQLGDGSAATRLRPVRVSTPEPAVAVSAGLYHSFAVGEAGGSMAWGFNGLGQLGNGNTVDQSRPVWVPLLPANYPYYQLSAGGFHSLGAGVQAQFAAAGWNAFTQVNARGGDAAGFIQPIGIQVAHAVSAGWYHGLILHTNGTVMSAGWNGQGQLGDGTVTTHGWGPVPGLAGVQSVSAGGMHSLAVTDDGHLRVWGWNGYGQLGTGTTVETHTPSAANALTNVTVASAGFLHSVAVRG